MKFKLENFRDNVAGFMRRCGYKLIDRSADGEWNFVRRLSNRDYPRFHCYLKPEAENLLLNLHLDQKKPSYEGSARHGGEYDGDVVEAEAERIRQIFLK